MALSTKLCLSCLFVIFRIPKSRIFFWMHLWLIEIYFFGILHLEGQVWSAQNLVEFLDFPQIFKTETESCLINNSVTSVLTLLSFFTPLHFSPPIQIINSISFALIISPCGLKRCKHHYDWAHHDKNNLSTKNPREYKLDDCLGQILHGECQNGSIRNGKSADMCFRWQNTQPTNDYCQPYVNYSQNS